MDDETRLAELIGCLSTDDSLTAYEYIHAEDDEIKGGLTEEEILEIVESKNTEESEKEKEEFIEQEKVSDTEAEICINTTLKFLYEQGSGFGSIEEEVKILRKLHKRVWLNIVKNLKQVDLHRYFQ